MRWRVTGADQQSGADQVLEIDAGSEDAAVKLAGRQGIFVESVKRVSQAKDAPVAEYAQLAADSTEADGASLVEMPKARRLGFAIRRRYKVIGGAMIVLLLVAWIYRVN